MKHKLKMKVRVNCSELLKALERAQQAFLQVKEALQKVKEALQSITVSVDGVAEKEGE